jgi:Family of unknown function (DUF695)
MPLFHRGRRDERASGGEQQAAIHRFWTWWRDEGRALTTSFIGGAVPVEQLAPAMAAAVHAVHPDLEWETSAGSESRHLLTVTAAGVPELRAVARRWRLAAPPADREWAYADVRLPATGDLARLSLQVDGREYAVGEASVDAYVRGLAVDVSVHHPQFADLDQPDRDRVALLLLDQVLGEEAVETWVGEVASSPVPALDPVPIGGLRSVVRDLREQHTDEHGRPSYVLMQGTGPTGSPVLVLARIPLTPATAPHLDTYVGLAVPYTDQTPDGLPGPGSLDRLRALEDRIARNVGDNGEVVAVQSHQGMRVLHLYVDGTTTASEHVRAAALAWDQGAVRVESHHDPAWSAVKHLRG